jgi:hypothetical protein
MNQCNVKVLSHAGCAVILINEQTGITVRKHKDEDKLKALSNSHHRHLSLHKLPIVPSCHSKTSLLPLPKYL